MKDARIILFFKRLIVGKVKTRLAAEIGEETALVVYRAMILDLLENLSAVSEFLVPYINEYDPQLDLKLAEILRIEPRIQHGKDLGARMYNALDEVFCSGAQRAVLIGSDIPHLTADVVIEYLSCLNEYQVVIGPAQDGGYYLIGFTRNAFTDVLFKNISWSSPDVLEKTLKNAEGAGVKCYVGKMFRDIDTVEDLKMITGSKEFSSLVPHVLKCMVLL